jgi:general nucleoside transport system ATP-binding protein
MDEPTAALGTADAALVADVARRLAAGGTAVVYITHKLREVIDVSDRVSVMRRGAMVASRDTRDTSARELADEMVETRPKRTAARDAPKDGEHVVSLRGVSVSGDGRRQGLTDVSLSVRRGEVVGVAGVIGNGQEALAGVLTGLLEPAAGEVEPRPVRVAYVPEDRAREGLATGLSVRDNAIVHRHRDPAMRRWGRLASAPVVEFVDALLANARVRAPGPGARAGALSGGNQQKLVLARELEWARDLIVANNPYRGLDVGATAEVREQLLDACSGGAGVLVISPDLDELFDISDRLVVLFEGRIVGELDAREAEVREVGRLMAGAT